MTGCLGPPAASTAPVAAFSVSPAAGPAHEPFQFNASNSTDADGSLVAFRWDFGDGSNGSGVAVTHSFSAAGNYTVTLTVVDDDGVEGVAQRHVNVVVLPPTTAWQTHGWAPGNFTATVTSATGVGAIPTHELNATVWASDDTVFFAGPLGTTQTVAGTNTSVSFEDVDGNARISPGDEVRLEVTPASHTSLLEGGILGLSHRGVDVAHLALA